MFFKIYVFKKKLEAYIFGHFAWLDYIGKRNWQIKQLKLKWGH